jgi:hypothetical protein
MMAEKYVNVVANPDEKERLLAQATAVLELVRARVAAGLKPQLSHYLVELPGNRRWFLTAGKRKGDRLVEWFEPFNHESMEHYIFTDTEPLPWPTGAKAHGEHIEIGNTRPITQLLGCTYTEPHMDKDGFMNHRNVQYFTLVPMEPWKDGYIPME